MHGHQPGFLPGASVKNAVGVLVRIDKRPSMRR